MNTDRVIFGGERTIFYRNAMTAKRLTNIWRIIMWTKPAATEMRFGFEVTMYVMNK
jgi:pyrroloquinoline quinone biosynthesis protein A